MQEKNSDSVKEAEQKNPWANIKPKELSEVDKKTLALIERILETFAPPEEDENEPHQDENSK